MKFLWESHTKWDSYVVFYAYNPQLLMQEIYNTELIRFYYHETTLAENKAIVNRLQLDSEYLESWENLKITLSELQECELDPNPTSVNIILEYAHRGVVSA